jgi:hypothetical protein
VAAEQETERGHEDQQQGKLGEKAVPGQQGGEVAALVVAELLDHGEQEPEPAVALLVAVDAAEGSFNRVHHGPRPGRMLAGRSPGRETLIGRVAGARRWRAPVGCSLRTS